MKKLPWYAVMVPFLMVVCLGVIAGAALFALVWLVLDEIKQRHNRLALHQQIDSFLAQQRQHK